MSSIAEKEVPSDKYPHSRGMDAREHQKMAQVESDLWWYRVLHKKVLKALNVCGLSKQDPVLDAGCGTGGLLSVLSAAGYTNLSGFDASPTAKEICAARGFDIKTIEIEKAESVYPHKAYAALISNDVLCYLTDEEVSKTIRTLSLLVKPGGHLILNLPAYQAFSGIHDVSVGVVSRTTKETIQKYLIEAGFEIMDLHHWPFLLSPVIYLTRLKQRRMLKNNSNCLIESDISVPSFLVNALLSFLTSVEALLGSARIWGSSIFIIASKTCAPMKYDRVP